MNNVNILQCCKATYGDGLWPGCLHIGMYVSRKGTKSLSTFLLASPLTLGCSVGQLFHARLLRRSNEGSSIFPTAMEVTGYSEQCILPLHSMLQHAFLQ